MRDQDLPLFQSNQEVSENAPLGSTRALSVSEITSRIKRSLEGDFLQIWVKGEISNYKPVSSGHAYFSLKDEGATIAIAAFGWGKKKHNFELKDGLEVLVCGNISVYAPRGNYQLLVDTIEPVGAGALQLAFQQLKEKLKKEGVFERKRPLPKYPARLVVITSHQAAALRDVLTVLKRRAPFLDVVIIPSLVQGADAAPKLIQALKIANHYQMGDVILLTRGGGSIEDLWAFNDEALARAIAESAIPIVSAVGHEIDFTIADFAADLRAPTPSAGAEIITHHWVEMREKMRSLNERLLISLKRDLILKRRTLEMLQAKLKNPRDRLREQSQRVDELSANLERSMRRILERHRMRLDHVSSSLETLSPKNKIREQTARVDDLQINLERNMRRILERYQMRLAHVSSSLEALSPLGVLSRGYTLVRGGPGQKVVKQAAQVVAGQIYSLHFSDGTVEVTKK